MFSKRIVSYLSYNKLERFRFIQLSFSVFLLLAFVFTCAYVTHAEKIGPEEIRSIHQENGVVHYRNGLNLDKAVGKKGRITLRAVN